MAAATGCAGSSSNSSGSVLTQCPTRWSCPSTDWPAAGMPTTTCDWLDSRDNSAAKLASRVANRLTPRRAPIFLIAATKDRKSVVSGKSVSVRVDHGGRHILKKKTQHKTYTAEAK